MSARKYVLLGLTTFLSVTGVSIIWRFLTIKYPTHSDVFFMGVEAGALAVLFLICISLIGYFLRRFATTK